MACWRFRVYSIVTRVASSLAYLAFGAAPAWRGGGRDGYRAGALGMPARAIWHIARMPHIRTQR